MTILAIDTSTSRGSVALLADEQVVFAEDFLADRSHGAALFTVLARARELAPKLDQIVVGLGPGSYAGIRIAISAAIGLELATGASLLGAPSVAAWETGVPSYIAVGDARRETFYWTRVEDGTCLAGPRPPPRADLESEGAAATLPLFAIESLPGIPDLRIALPSARVLARMATRGSGLVNTQPLEPIYLRPAVRPGGSL